MEFTISIEPLNEPEREHWCDVGGCQEQILFLDEYVSKVKGENVWVCWPHGQLALRETNKWWPSGPQRFQATVTTPMDPGIVVGTKVRYVPDDLINFDPAIKEFIGRTGVVVEIRDDLLRVTLDPDNHRLEFTPKTDFLRRERPSLY